jgi:hypothetical protein
MLAASEPAQQVRGARLRTQQFKWEHCIRVTRPRHPCLLRFHSTSSTRPTICFRRANHPRHGRSAPTTPEWFCYRCDNNGLMSNRGDPTARAFDSQRCGRRAPKSASLGRSFKSTRRRAVTAELGAARARGIGSLEES